MKKIFILFMIYIGAFAQENKQYFDVVLKDNSIYRGVTLKKDSTVTEVNFYSNSVVIKNNEISSINKSFYTEDSLKKFQCYEINRAKAQFPEVYIIIKAEGQKMICLNELGKEVEILRSEITSYKEAKFNLSAKEAEAKVKILRPQKDEFKIEVPEGNTVNLESVQQSIYTKKK